MSVCLVTTLKKQVFIESLLNRRSQLIDDMIVVVNSSMCFETVNGVVNTFYIMTVVRDSISVATIANIGIKAT